MFCGKPVLYFRPNLEGLEHRLAPSANPLWQEGGEISPEYAYVETITEIPLRVDSELPALTVNTEPLGHERGVADIKKTDAGLVALDNFDKDFSEVSLNLRDDMTEPAREEARDIAFANPEEVPLPFQDMPNDTEPVDLVFEIQ